MIEPCFQVAYNIVGDIRHICNHFGIFSPKNTPGDIHIFLYGGIYKCMNDSWPLKGILFPKFYSIISVIIGILDPVSRPARVILD